MVNEKSKGDFEVDFDSCCGRGDRVAAAASVPCEQLEFLRNRARARTGTRTDLRIRRWPSVRVPEVAKRGLRESGGRTRGNPCRCTRVSLSREGRARCFQGRRSHDRRTPPDAKATRFLGEPQQKRKRGPGPTKTRPPRRNGNVMRKTKDTDHSGQPGVAKLGG